MDEQFISDETPAGIVGVDKPPENVGIGPGPRNILGPVLSELDTVAGLCSPDEVTIFLTSLKWARVAKEVEALNQGKPNPENFRRLRMRTTTFVNSGSEDEEAVNAVNLPEALRIGFQDRRRRLVSGRK